MNSKTVTPKRKFGQNFLVNTDVKKKAFAEIDKLLAMYPGFDIVEVGPGQGDLTQHLAKTGRLVDAIEIDPEAFEVVSGEFDNHKNIQSHLTDAMEELNKTQNSLFSGDKILISNLPYNIGSRLLVDLAVVYPDMPFAVILQNEVARKPLLQTDFTLFGAWIRLFWGFSYLFRISPGSFYPSPKVFSAMVIGRPVKSDYSQAERIKLLQTLKSLVAHPSKTLANNLKNLGMNREAIDKFMKDNKLDINTRLGWGNYKNILDSLI